MFAQARAHVFVTSLSFRLNENRAEPRSTCEFLATAMATQRMKDDEGMQQNDEVSFWTQQIHIIYYHIVTYICIYNHIFISYFWNHLESMFWIVLIYHDSHVNLLTQTSKCNVSISWITVQSLWLLSLLFVNLHLLVQPRLINKDLQDVPGPLMTAAGAPSIPNLRIKMRHLQVVSVYSKSILSLSCCALIAPWRMSIKLNSWMGCMGVLPSKLSTLSVVSKADLCTCPHQQHYPGHLPCSTAWTGFSKQPTPTEFFS